MQKHFEFFTLWASLFVVTFIFFLWHEGSVIFALGYATIIAAIKASVVQIHRYAWATRTEAVAESEPSRPS